MKTLLVIVVMVAVYTAAVMAVLTYAADIAQGQSAPTCFEDEPCWNCHSMGNRVCGAGFILNGRAHVASTSRPWTWEIN